MSQAEEITLLEKDNKGLSRDLEAARKAYEAGDADASKAAHAVKAIVGSPEKHGGVGSEFIKSLVFGGLDGIITTFAIVSASVGAGFGVDVIILMGVANLIADGISMGFGDYLSSKAELEFALGEKKREEWECDNDMAGEVHEMVEIYQNKGMTEEDAKGVIAIMSKYREIFVDLMVVEELGLEVPSEDDEPWKEGCVTFIAFLLFGSVPLWMYVIFKLADASLGANTMFGLTCIATATTMFMLGVVKAKITKQNIWKSGGMMLANGSLAAAAAYLVGWLFEEVLQINVSGCQQ